MFNYLVRRLLIGCGTLLLITFLIYALIRLMPGDPLLARLEQFDPNRKVSQEEIERQRKAYGLDKFWMVAYAEWLGNVARLDLGNSISRNNESVSGMIRKKIGPTLMLTLNSLVLAYLLSIPLGIYCSVRSGRLDERTISTTLYMLYSLPSFVAALLLQMFFAVKLEALPLYGMRPDDFADMSTWEQTWQLFRHAVLPVACFTYGALAFETRFIRANMQEVIRQDYIRTAWAKGLAPARVYVGHAFRNTLIPLVTLLGLTLPALLSGAIILERIFAWPGMGTLFFEAIRERDYPTIMGLVLMFSVLTLVGQLVADLLYAVVDPRITYS
jgi:peptide/nickel transport system permease protein